MARNKKLKSSDLLLMETTLGEANDPKELKERSIIRQLNRNHINARFGGWSKKSDLNFLLEGVGLDLFLKKYLGKMFLHHKANRLEWFSNLFTFEKMVNHIISDEFPHSNIQVFDRFSTKLEKSRVSTFKNDRSYIDKKKLIKLLKTDGGSISVNHLNKSNLQIHDLAEQFSSWTHSACGVNAYWTPAGGKTFGWHWDTHDFFILQIEGEKRWELFEPILKFPQDDLKFNFSRWPEEKLKRAKRKAVVILEAGDILYVPAGTPHDVKALNSKDSMHLTVSISSGSWLNVFEKYFELVEHRIITFNEMKKKVYNFNFSPSDLKAFNVMLKKILYIYKETSLPQVRKCLKLPNRKK